MSSSRSNSRSSNDAAIPNHPGMAAGSVRATRALLTMTTFPRPIGRLTSTTSSSMGVCAASWRGHRKKTPDELMSRVTSVIGKSSARPFTLRRRSGSRKLALGYSRCSGNIPTACVGTRANRRTGLSGLKGNTLNDGTRGAPVAGIPAPDVANGPNGSGLTNRSSTSLRTAWLDAFISPSVAPSDRWQSQARNNWRCRTRLPAEMALMPGQ